MASAGSINDRLPEARVVDAAGGAELDKACRFLERCVENDDVSVAGAAAAYDAMPLLLKSHQLVTSNDR